MRWLGTPKKQLVYMTNYVLNYMLNYMFNYVLNMVNCSQSPAGLGTAASLLGVR